MMRRERKREEERVREKESESVRVGTDVWIGSEFLHLLMYH